MQMGLNSKNINSIISGLEKKIKEDLHNIVVEGIIKYTNNKIIMLVDKEEEGYTPIKCICKSNVGYIRRMNLKQGDKIRIYGNILPVLEDGLICFYFDCKTIKTNLESLRQNLCTKNTYEISDSINKVLIEKGHEEVIVQGIINSTRVDDKNNYHFNLVQKNDKNKIQCIVEHYRDIGIMKYNKQVIIIGRFICCNKNNNLCYKIYCKKIKLLHKEQNNKVCVKYPKKIGLIVAKKSKVKGDIVNVCKRIYKDIEIVSCKVKMEGQEAVADIIKAMNDFKKNKCDLIIIARGGGGQSEIEDTFNDIKLCDAISYYPTPVIVGIAHAETKTMVDYVATQRADTPTGVAELIMKGYNETLIVDKEELENIFGKINWIKNSKDKNISIQSSGLSIDFGKYMEVLQQIEKKDNKGGYRDRKKMYQIAMQLIKIENAISEVKDYLDNYERVYKKIRSEVDNFVEILEEEYNLEERREDKIKNQMNAIHEKLVEENFLDTMADYEDGIFDDVLYDA